MLFKIKSPDILQFASLHSCVMIQIDFQVAEDRGGAMDKISGMIPPPPTMGDDSDKEADEDDWD